MTTIFERVETALGTITPPVDFAMAPYEGMLPDLYIVHQLLPSGALAHADNKEIARGYVVQVTIWSKAGLVSIPDVNTAMTTRKATAYCSCPIANTMDEPMVPATRPARLGLPANGKLAAATTP